jgi:archaellum biogenesis ATPase FlaH
MILEVMGEYVHIDANNKVCCPFHKENTPSLSIKPDDEYFKCFGCGESGDAIKFVMLYEDLPFKEALARVAQIMGITPDEVMKEKAEQKEAAPVKTALQPRLDTAIQKDLWSYTGYLSKGYRGIRDEINEFYGHRTSLNDDGSVAARFYPETNAKGQLCGYKCRNHPKDFSFGKVGSTGNKSQLSGQAKFRAGGKYVLYVGGEEDKCAAYQMLLDADRDKELAGKPVVSPTSGEGSAKVQAAAQYEWFDQFEVIMIGMDNDEAGNKAAQEIASVLPQHKVRIIKWSGKDPNAMLIAGQERQFVRDFWNAKPVVNTGIMNSTDTMDAVKEELRRPRLSLPHHMNKLAEAIGFPGPQQGRIINIIGDTSVGKSTHVNGLVYHWIFNGPEKVGVVSLEATAGQYGIDMLSLHLEQNLIWNRTGLETIAFLETPEVVAMSENLWTTESGEPRWALLDERDGDIKNLERQIERLIHQFGCKIIVIDVLTDILRGMPMDQQEEHMKWQKKVIKNGVTIVNVLHTRKPGQSADGKVRRVTEYDALGSGSFVQSAAINIVVIRDKMAAGDEKHITYFDLPKCRGGITGENVMALYYDWATRKVYDYDDYLMGAASKPPETEQM